MRKINTLLFAALLGLSAVYGAKEEDLVKSMPDCGDTLPSKWYSGYLNVTKTKALHYIFIESTSEDAKNDPVVVWFNGGPGCSSLLGMFAEHGPFIIDDGESVIKPNPEPWTKRANLLYIESPAGVGFSYAAGEEDRRHNDMSTSIDAFIALESFYADFKEYLPNKLFISGESYGGIYVPYLTW